MDWSLFHVWGNGIHGIRSFWFHRVQWGAPFLCKKRRCSHWSLPAYGNVNWESLCSTATSTLFQTRTIKVGDYYGRPWQIVSKVQNQKGKRAYKAAGAFSSASFFTIFYKFLNVTTIITTAISCSFLPPVSAQTSQLQPGGNECTNPFLIFKHNGQPYLVVLFR